MLLVGATIFITSLLLAGYSTGKVIYITHKKHLFDEPGETRKIHKTRTPNLGGVAIFASTMFTSCLFVPAEQITSLNIAIACATIIFIVGLVDDLVGMNPMKKMLAQLIVALLATTLADFRISNLHGLFGIHEIPPVLSVSGTVLFILVTINAFNLIDGINWLAGTISLLVMIAFAVIFGMLHLNSYMYLSIAISGTLCAFLYYNRTPAKIFMGDTGSLFLGLTIALLSIRFLSVSGDEAAASLVTISPALVAALLFLPMFDTVRIFCIRIKNKKPPFAADKNHIHHALIDLGFTHIQASLLLAGVNLLLIAFVTLSRSLAPEILIIGIVIIALVLNQMLQFFLKRHAAILVDKMEPPVVAIAPRFVQKVSIENAQPQPANTVLELTEQD